MWFNTAGKQLSTSRYGIVVDFLQMRFDYVDSDLLDFSSGVYFISRPECPSNEDEMKFEYRRACYRLGETDYSATSNNCESLVTLILTGKATCAQFEQSNQKKRIAMDAIDGGIDHCKKALLNGQSDLPARIIAIDIAQLARDLIKFRI